MKTITVRNLQKNIGTCIDAAQKTHVVVTRHGKPAAIVVGVEGSDWEDVLLQTSPTFWKMIEQRRREKTISLQEMRRHLSSLPRKARRR